MYARLSLSASSAGHVSQAATVQRYTTIRNFFRQYPSKNLRQFPSQPPTRHLHTFPSAFTARLPRDSRSFSRESDTAASPTPSGRHYPKTPPESQPGSRSQNKVGSDHSSQPQEATPSHQSTRDPQVQPYNIQHYSQFYKRLAASAPTHRPTVEDFLNVATGFWQRARIRFKWFSIKSFRRFNADDISALVTWFLMSQTAWILVGTTTFFSVVFAIVNSLRLQNLVARSLSDYLTSETGVTIVFESAIVPKWKDSRISFKNVYVSRRAGTKPSPPVLTGLPHSAAAGYDVSNHPSNYQIHDVEEDLQDHGVEDVNMTMFDLTVDSIDVTLSLWRWLDGRGLVEDAVIKGVRGVIDRQHVHWDPDQPADPTDSRRTHTPGDFELDSLRLEDLLVTVYQPGGFRPYTASIFRADIRCFRKQWLFYDVLSAQNIVGQFDNCLFSLHTPQSIGRTAERDLADREWARISRLRIDGVSIDHLQHSTSMEGPVSWIKSGKVDAVLDIKFPRDPSQGVALNEILGEIADAISTSISTVTDPALDHIPAYRELAKPALSAPDTMRADVDESAPKVIIDIDLRFRDVKAAVPIFNQDLSYVSNALSRPIVAFMNANRTLVPIKCHVVKNLSDFDGAWTIWESGLTDEISLKIYEALAFHVTQANMNRRIKTVSLWSLQMTASTVLSALRNAVDPISSHMKMYLEPDDFYALHDT